MAKIIFIAPISILFLLSVLSYWCYNKHWGTIGLFGTSVYINIASYLMLMSTYLFDDSLLCPILIIILISGIFIAAYTERVLLIDRPIRHFCYTALLASSLILIGYSKLLLSWSTISFDYFQISSISSGFACGILLGLFMEDTLIHFSTRCFYWYEQLIKILAGLLVCILLIFMLYRFYNIPTIAFFLSAMVSLWICGLYPVFIRRIQHYQYKNN